MKVFFYIDNNQGGGETLTGTSNDPLTQFF